MATGVGCLWIIVILINPKMDVIRSWYLFYLSYEANTSDIVVLELKCDKLVNLLHMMHTLPDLHIIC